MSLKKDAVDHLDAIERDCRDKNEKIRQAGEMAILAI